MLEHWISICKKTNFNPYFTPYAKITFKSITDLNVRPDTIKLLEENIGRTLCDINHSKILLT